jgi:hypothetical protein
MRASFLPEIYLSIYLSILHCRGEARFAERTDWLGPDPARCFDCPLDPAPAEQ